MFLVNSIIFFIPILIAAIFWIKAQREFEEVYRLKKKPSFPVTQEERMRKVEKEPLKFLMESPRGTTVLWKESFKHHSDPELDKAAKAVKKWFYVVVLVFTLSIVFSIIF